MRLKMNTEKSVALLCLSNTKKIIKNSGIHSTQLKLPASVMNDDQCYNMTSNTIIIPEAVL